MDHFRNPSKELATSLLDIFMASSSVLPLANSVIMEEVAIAAAHPNV